MRRREGQIIKSLESGAKYRLGEFLGKGGFGSVWRCENAKGRSPRCLKLTDDQNSWHREAYMAGLIGDHPRVVRVYETFPVFDGRRVSYAVVMELAERGTLSDVVEKDGAWNEPRAIYEVTKLLDVVDRLHSAGTLHRDITPYNVFACGSAGRTLKLGDFGIATSGPKKGVKIDAFNHWFADTEIREEQRNRWDGSEDLWQVAQLLAVMLTGEVETVKRANIRNMACSDATKQVIARAIGDRSGRFGSAKAMADALQGIAPVRVSRPHSLQGRNIVFTGRLSIPRLEASELAQAAGANVARYLSTTTDLLVVGPNKLFAAGAAGGDKLLAAAAMREGGHRIDEVKESWFLRLVGRPQANA
jgi:serine/threonine protein kinase